MKESASSQESGKAQENAEVFKSPALSTKDKVVVESNDEDQSQKLKEPKGSMQSGGDAKSPLHEEDADSASKSSGPKAKQETSGETVAHKNSRRAGGHGEYGRDGRKQGRGDGRQAGRGEHRQHGREDNDSRQRGRGPPKRDEREGRGRGRGRDGRDGRSSRGSGHVDSVHEDPQHHEVEAAEGSDQFAKISSRKSSRTDEEKIRNAQMRNEELTRSVMIIFLRHVASSIVENVWPKVFDDELFR